MKNLQAIIPGEYDNYSGTWKCKIVDTTGKLIQLASGVTKLDAENAGVLIAAAWDLREALEMVNDADNDNKSDGNPGIPSLPKRSIERALIKSGIKL